MLAIALMLIQADLVAFMEKESGSITTGKFADFVVLDEDIMTIAAEDILKPKVVMTVLGGKAVYGSP